MDPGRLLQVLKETTRYTTRESRATELKLRGHVLTIVVENDRARTTRELVVRSFARWLRTSRRPPTDQQGGFPRHRDPRYVLDYLAAQRQSFALSFPPKKGTPRLCRSEGFRFAHLA